MVQGSRQSGCFTSTWQDARNAGQAWRRSSLSQPGTAAKALGCRVSTGFGAGATEGGSAGTGVGAGLSGCGVVQAARVINREETSKLEYLNDIVGKSYVAIVS